MSLSDVAVISFLNENWMRISNPEAFEQIFQEQLYPFLSLIYEERIPSKVRSMFRKFEVFARRYLRIAMSNKTVRFIESNQLQHLLPTSSNESFAVKLCQEYLDKGIGHILVGMRKENYVEEMSPLFAGNVRTTWKESNNFML
jgi:hypothetical protein